MTSETINDLAGAVAIAITVPAVANVLIYGLGSRWWETWLGRVLFSKWLSVALVFLYIVSRRVWGDYPWYEWVALILYSFVLVSFSATTIELLIERQAPAAALELPPPNRKAVTMTNNTTAGEAPVIWYKGKRVVRTIVQALVTLVPILNGLALAAAAYLREQADVVVPGWVFIVLNAIIAVTALIMGLVARLMAVPGVNDWLVKIGLGSVPAAAIQAPGVVAPDPRTR